MAKEIALASTAVLVIAAAAGWLLARRITRRLEALAGVAEDISEHGGVDRQVPVEGVDEVGRLSSAFNTMLTGSLPLWTPRNGSSRTPRTSSAPRSPACAPTPASCA